MEEQLVFDLKKFFVASPWAELDAYAKSLDVDVV
jgi:hypothetical protein